MLEPGTTYEGRVTGTGLMLDGGYLYEMEHKCSLVLAECGDVIKMRGEGMPVHQSSERGDLYVKIEIQFPTQLTEKQIESK